MGVGQLVQRGCGDSVRPVEHYHRKRLRAPLCSHCGGVRRNARSMETGVLGIVSTMAMLTRALTHAQTSEWGFSSEPRPRLVESFLDS
jgi:hypothetical protein